MKKILFYDKQVYWNSPYYAIDILNKLRFKGYEIFVIHGKEDTERIENLTNFSLFEIYKDFPNSRVHKLGDVLTVIKYFKPDILLTNFALFRMERSIINLAKRESIKVIEMDNIASEIMFYNKKHYLHMFSLRSNSLVLFVKQKLRYEFNRLISKKKCRTSSLKSSYVDSSNIPFLADKICIKGKFFQDYLTQNPRSDITKEVLPITGSLQLDEIYKPNKGKKHFLPLFPLKKISFFIEILGRRVEKSLTSKKK